jgi:hypothetical protein
LFPTLQVGITVTDVTGFAYTKKIATCATSGGGIDFGAFSNYGTTSVQFSYTATAPVTAFITRNSSTGYLDSLVATSQASFSTTLPAVDGDSLTLTTNPNLPLPSGTRVKSRIDGGGGAFAESTIVAAPNSAQPFVLFNCCGPRPVVSGSVVDIVLRIVSFGTTPDESYTYTFRITDPATGAVIGSQTGTTFSRVNFPPLRVQRGHVIEMDVTPNAPGGSVDISVELDPSGGFSARASSNEVGTPARFKVFCCSP